MTQANHRLPDMSPDPDAAQKLLIETIMAGRGRLPTPFRIWLQSPELAALLHPLGAFLAKDTTLDKREAEVAILAVARHWQAHYVFAVHAEEAEVAGIPKAAIHAIEAGDSPDLATERQRLVYEVVSTLARRDAVDDATFADAVRMFGHKGVAELLALAGYFTAVGLAMKLYAVDPPRK